MNYKTFGIDEIRTFAHEKSANSKLSSHDVIIVFTESELNEVQSALDKSEMHYRISKQFDGQKKFENFIIAID